MKLSIIVPVYNVEKYILECLYKNKFENYCFGFSEENQERLRD